MPTNLTAGCSIIGIQAENQKQKFAHTYVHVWSVYKIGNMYGAFVVSET